MKLKLMITFLMFGLVFMILFGACDARLIGLTVIPTKYDFNKVNIGDSAEYQIIITNISANAIRITEYAFIGAASFTITDGGDPVTLTGNQIHRVTIRFEPIIEGTQTATLQIFHDGPGLTRTCELSGIGIPVPRIFIPETNYDFGTVGIGLTAIHNFEVQNVGSADLIISFFNFVGNTTLYSITAGGIIPVNITPGDTHIVTVQFAPTATGDFPTVLEISHNAINEVPPSTVEIDARGGGGRIEVNQTSPWDFGLAPVGMGGITDDIEISNTGSINLNISNIYLMTGFEFSIENIEDSAGNPLTAPFGIVPYDFVVVTIKFEPSSIQQFNDTLSIDNDGSYAPSPLDISLVGTGRALIKQIFNYTGSAQQWNVPAGIQKVKAECWGAEGGRPGNHGLGGKGGRASANVPVTPGVTIYAYVGQKAINVNGGWNGGGTGTLACTGAGGGGASDIRIGGTALADRRVVGGGGGGGGYNFFQVMGK